jgi:hypothetical protein
LYNGDGYAFATGDNIVGNRYLQMVADDEITYSFYTDTENLIVYPIMYIFSSSAVDVKLDYGQRQPFAVINDLLSTSSKSSILNFSTQAAAEFNIVKGMTPTNPKSLTYNEKGIVITSKGWHTLNVKCNTGNVAVSGIKFKDA